MTRPTFAKTCRENLLTIADAYAQATGLSIPTVSRKFHGNQAFLGRFREGKIGVTLEKLSAMLDAFRQSWPQRTAWPVRGDPLWSRRG